MKVKTILCVAMAAASAVAAGGRPAFEGEFMCGVNFGFYAREGYYESQAAHDEVDEMARTGIRGFTIRGKPAQEVMRRHYTQMAKPMALKCVGEEGTRR